MKGNQRNWSSILFRRKPLGGGLIQGDLVGRIFSMGDGCTFCTPPSAWLPMADPLPIVPPWPFHLPPCFRENVSSSREGWGCCVWPPSSTWAPDRQCLLGCSSLSAQPLFCGCWFFPHFPPGEEQFPNAGMEYKQKVMDSAVTEQPEASATLTEQRMIPRSVFSSPFAPCWQT